MSSKRESGVVLVARKDCEYWFIDSVFWHDKDLFGCTGTTVYPVSPEQAEEALSIENLEDRFGDYWAESVKDKVQPGCGKCSFYGPNEEGCVDCGYQSLSDFCADIARHDGYDAVFEYPGHDYEVALCDLLVSDDNPDAVETVDTSGCGRILARPMKLSDFDEVYNRKALEACFAYEAGDCTYGAAVRAIFGR